MSIYSNPFDFEKPVQKRELFAGRKQELKDIDYYLQMMTQPEPSYHNLSIIGKRAAGKTSLLYMIKSMAEENNILPVVVSLDNDSSSNEILFFKELFDGLLSEGIKKNLFGGVKGTLWRTYRKLIDTLDLSVEIPFEFGTAYVGAKKEKQTSISQFVMKNDLDSFLSKAREENIRGIAILLDECDLLATNQTLLQKIRHVFSEIEGYMLVFSGTEKMFPAMDDVFSPLPRMFRRITIENFKTVDETKESILSRLSEDEKLLISDQTIAEIHHLTNGDPYEIQLISHFLYKSFKENNAARIELNTAVLENIMNELERLRQGHPEIATLIKKCPKIYFPALRAIVECPNATRNELSFLMTLSKIKELPVENIGRDKQSNQILISDLQKTLLDEKNSRLFFKGDSFDLLFLKYHLLSSGINIISSGSNYVSTSFSRKLIDLLVVGIEQFREYVLFDIPDGLDVPSKNQMFTVGGKFKPEKIDDDGKSTITVFDVDRDQQEFYNGAPNSIRFRINLEFLNSGFVLQLKFTNENDLNLAKKRLSELKTKLNLIDIKILEKDEIEFVNDGRKLILEKKFVESLEKFNEAKAINPDYELLWANMGAAYYNLKQYQDALDCYKKWSELRPSLASPLENMGRCYISLGNNDDAFTCLEKASKISPESWSIWDNFGRALMNLDKFSEAVDAFDKCLSLKEDDYDAKRYKGHCLSNLKKDNLAIQIFDELLTINENDLPALHDKSISLFQLGKYQDSLDIVESLEKNPACKIPRFNLLGHKSLVLDKLGRQKDALLCCDELLTIDKDHVITWYNKACFESTSGQINDALISLEKAISLNEEAVLSMIDDEKDFDPIRSDPRFKNLISKDV